MKNKISLPRTRLGRMFLGFGLIVGGFLAVLPVFGMWMIPVGLWVLSKDFASVRRFRRRWTVKLGRWAQSQPWVQRQLNKLLPVRRVDPALSDKPHSGFPVQDKATRRGGHADK